MKLVIRVDPETGEVYGMILRPGEKLPPLVKPRMKKKEGFKDKNNKKNGSSDFLVGNRIKI